MPSKSNENVTASKDEYTAILCNYLYTAMYQGLKSLWNESRKTAYTDPHNPNILKNFQNRLESIPQWNQDAIDDEYERIVSETGVEYYDKLVGAVFNSNVKVLCAITDGNNDVEINLRIPTAKSFVHKCYVECARAFYRDPQLFEDRMGKEITINENVYKEDSRTDSNKRQKNLKESLEIINKSIQNTIRNLLPMNEILEMCLNPKKEETSENEMSDFEGSDSEQEEPEESKEQRLLRSDFSELQNPEKTVEPESSGPEFSNDFIPPPPIDVEVTKEVSGEIRQISLPAGSMQGLSDETVPVNLPPITQPGDAPPPIGNEPSFFSDDESE